MERRSTHTPRSPPRPKSTLAQQQQASVNRRPPPPTHTQLALLASTQSPAKKNHCSSVQKIAEVSAQQVSQPASQNSLWRNPHTFRCCCCCWRLRRHRRRRRHRGFTSTNERGPNGHTQLQLEKPTSEEATSDRRRRRRRRSSESLNSLARASFASAAAAGCKHCMHRAHLVSLDFGCKSRENNGCCCGR